MAFRSFSSRSTPHKPVGVVAKSTERYLSQPSKSQSESTYTAVDSDIEIEDEEEEAPEPVKILEEVSTFDNIVVWGHDRIPASDDPFVKGIEEWISFAEAIHGKPKQQTGVNGEEKTTS